MPLGEPPLAKELLLGGNSLAGRTPSVGASHHHAPPPRTIPGLAILWDALHGRIIPRGGGEALRASWEQFFGMDILFSE